MPRRIHGLATLLAIGLSACTIGPPTGQAPSASASQAPSSRPAPLPIAPDASGPAIEDEGAAVAYAEAYGAVLATTVGKPACIGPRGALTLAIRARQPNGQTFDYRSFGASAIGSNATSGGQIFLGEDGQLYQEHGEPLDGYVAIGTYVAESLKEGSPLTLQLAAGSKFVAGYPAALHDPRGWVTLKFAPPGPGVITSPKLVQGPQPDCGGSNR